MMRLLQANVGRGDWLIMGIAGVLLISLYLGLWTAAVRSAEAMIRVDGKNWARLDLYQNQDFHVPGPLGESHIQVRDGRVRFVSSPCPNQLCVHTGWLQKSGEVAICMPNRVSVKVLASDPRYDSMLF